jgi:hypothetical protein
VNRQELNLEPSEEVQFLAIKSISPFSSTPRPARVLGRVHVPGKALWPPVRIPQRKVLPKGKRAGIFGSVVLIPAAA